MTMTMKSTICLVALLFVAASASVSLRSVVYDRQNIPPQWKVVGFASPSDHFRLTFALKQQNLDKLERLFWAVSDPDSPQYRQFLSREEIDAIVATPLEEVETVVAWLKENGVKECQISRRSDNLRVNTTVEAASRLFQTQFFHFKHEFGHRVIRQLGEWSLPSHMTHLIDMVTGVTDFPMPSRRRVRDPNGVDAVVVESIQNIYQIPAGSSAPNTSQGVAEFGSGQYFSPSSLQQFAQQMGIQIEPLTSDHIVHPLPPVGVEGTLDIQYIAALGNKSVNWYWSEDDWLYEFGTDFNSHNVVPEVVSISYGWSESAQCEVTNQCSVLGVDSEGYVKKVNTEFQKIGLRGTSLLSASGDSGANGRTDPDCLDTQLHPPFPAASPYLTAVGATQLVNPDHSLKNPPPVCNSGSWSCVSGGQETAVSYDEAGFTSGGGFSNYVARPSYQEDAVTKYLNSGVTLPPASMFKSQNRGFPDVAAVGHNVLIYAAQLGGIAAVGGTSASSPEFGGVISLLNGVSKTKSGKTLGFLNPLLYKMASDAPKTFRDITVGDNICTEQGCSSSCKGFKCASGWDPVTGLGVPNVSEMLTYVKNL